MIELVPFERSHFDDLISWSPDAEFLLQWAGPGLQHPLDHAQLDALVASAVPVPAPNPAPDPDSPGTYLFSVVRNADGARIGHAELGLVDRRNQSAKLMRILIGPEDARGQGYGDALVRALVGFGFEELGLHRLDLSVFEFNASARRCYERAGFKLEGILRESRKSGDEYWSTCVMAILRHEWEAGAAAS
jgi:ribosomal protein S18 acetylase RimI-like enzyme